ncbi:MAG: hypothetical protein P1U87_23170 [Verrucomicrobiales bacterium]|nr:hypothetical protein [Verrucomicrobiales bacterium]
MASDSPLEVAAAPDADSLFQSVGIATLENSLRRGIRIERSTPRSVKDINEKASSEQTDAFSHAAVPITVEKR